MTPASEDTPYVNPNIFSYDLQGKKCYADPLKARRILLQHTMGKCWGIVKAINKTKQDIATAREHFDELEKDLEVNPTTQEEYAKLEELQKLREENKQSTYPFEWLPRIQKLEAYSGQVAILCKKHAEYEGILAEASAVAFDLPELNIETGEGVTELEAIEILKKFMEYAEGKGERLGS